MSASANANANSISQIKQQWAVAKYNTPHDKQLEALTRLVNEAEDLYVRDRHNADASLWYGISLATYASYASVNGGWFSTIHNKVACAHLEESLILNPQAQNGLAHTILGALYQKTDQIKAQNHFKMALSLDPDGLESNYHYGAFLVNKGEKQQAKIYLHKALNAPHRINDELADQGQRAQVYELIGQIS